MTIIKKKYLNKMLINTSELFEIMENPEGHFHERFIITGYILGFSETNGDKIFKKLCQSCKKV